MINVDRKSIAACNELYRQLDKLPGFITIGIGADALNVYVANPDEIKDKVPTRFNGFDVVLKSSGAPVPA